MGFQKTVLIVALVILTLAVIVMATVISNNESKKKWPPEIATCPPYYKAQGDATTKSISCVRTDGYPTIGNGGTNCKEYEMTDSNDASKFISDKKKCEWAKGCGIQWDGITASDCTTRSSDSLPVNKIKTN